MKYLLLLSLVLSGLQASYMPVEEKKKQDFLSLIDSTFRKYSTLNHLSISDLDHLKDPTIVDLRDQKLKEISSLPNSISLTDFKKIPSDKLNQGQFIFYSTTGIMSAQWLEDHFPSQKNFYNLSGGILYWVYQSKELTGTGPLMVEEKFKHLVPSNVAFKIIRLEEI